MGYAERRKEKSRKRKPERWPRAPFRTQEMSRVGGAWRLAPRKMKKGTRKKVKNAPRRYTTNVYPPRI